MDTEPYLDDEQPTREFPAGGNGQHPDPGSLLAQIKARRDERAADEFLDLPIPTWGGELVARYEVVDRDTLERMIARRNPSAQVDADFLVRACSGIYMLDGDTGELVPVPGHYEGEVARYDAALGEALSLDAGSGRELVTYLFRDNVVAISSHALKVLRWMQDTSREVDDALLGE